MTTLHHVSDDLLLRYEAGTLAEGWSLAVATHLALCPECRRRARAATAIGGALLEGMDAMPLDEGSFDLVMDRIAGSRAIEPAVEHRQADNAIIPEPLRSYIGGDVEELRWRRLGISARQILIKTSDPETSARLLRIPAGDPVPHPGHPGGAPSLGGYHGT